jgi:hypothetical protein
MGEAGRRFAEEHHSLERAADQLAAVCVRALSHGYAAATAEDVIR